MAKSSKSKKAAAKKSSNRSKKVSKKAAAKKGIIGNTFKVVCSKDGVLKRNLSRSEAKKMAEDHEAQTGHPTTFTGSQSG